MITSMTAFARIENQDTQGSLVCEMRSINHRYLEISLHLPEFLRVFETAIRDGIRKVLKRGKIECSFRYQSRAVNAQTLFDVNESLAKELVAASQMISTYFKEPHTIAVTDILRFPGVLEPKSQDLAQLKKSVLTVLENTLKDLLSMRQREGQELAQLFLQKLDVMQTELEKVKQRLPSINQEARERLAKRFADAKVEVDPARLEQEMVIFAQRIDITEEIERLETHITEMRRILKEGGQVGRRLDFLLQELNREANTLASKSVDTLITYAAVEMKVLIEQIREQVQNVE
jgi:uncharacterized protein (TIGR00255 family)